MTEEEQAGYGYASLKQWPEPGHQWHGERWEEFCGTAARANQALLRCAMWIATHDPANRVIRRHPAIEERVSFETPGQTQYRVSARLSVRD